MSSCLKSAAAKNSKCRDLRLGNGADRRALSIQLSNWSCKDSVRGGLGKLRIDMARKAGNLAIQIGRRVARSSKNIRQETEVLVGPHMVSVLK